MTPKVLDEKEMLEILELAKIAEQKMREATAMDQKCQRWHEAKQSVKS